MPIKIPNDLPAVQILAEENIFVMTEKRAMTQDIRPLKILLLNLMPKKVETETQITRILGNTPLQIELTLIRTKTHISQNIPEEYLLSFYKTFDEIKDSKFDGMIITGAPVEHLEFEDVDYWDELCEIMEWSKRNVQSTLHICWGAQAGLYYHYGIKKYHLDKKLFGIFPHKSEYPKSMLLRGFDDVFYAPHSRHTYIKREDVEACRELRILASSEEAGIHIVTKIGGRQFFVMGHSEYDALTLDAEYKRDKAAGLPIEIPVNYYADNNPSNPPVNTWKAHGNLLFTNWLNYFVYQSTPYDIKSIKDD